ncbi:hypothetical protein KJ780_04870 [Candidatus Micrarchaeota archaeon]|nr:hypothetical protein [Candidatus Micrarchaeota archaeon]
MEFLYPEYVGLLVMLTTFLIAATYMGGRIFRIPQWEAYFNIELYNLVVAVMILSVAFVFFEGSQLASRWILKDDPVTASKTFLNEVINKGVLPMYKDLLVIEVGASMGNAFMMRVGPSVWSFTYKVEPGVDAILSLSRLMGAGLLAIYGSLSIQHISLSFVEFFMPIILSIGVLLFIFPPTREAGAFLMCFAFAFQIVFPMTYALNQLALIDIMKAQNGGVYSPEMFGATFGTSTKHTFLAFITPFASIFNFEFIIPFITAMGRLAVITLVFPAISMTISIAFMNSLTKFLLGRT